MQNRNSKNFPSTYYSFYVSGTFDKKYTFDQILWKLKPAYVSDDSKK